MAEYVTLDELTQQPAKGYVTLSDLSNLKPLSAGEKLATGMADPIHGGAQLLTKLLPDSVVQAGNSFNNWLADKTGLVGRLPEGGVDQQVRQREQDYQARRSAQGETGADWWRIGGNVMSPANLALSYAAPAAAATLPARVGIGAVGGAASAALEPVTGEGDYADQKRKQVGIGFGAGAAVPLVTGAVGRLISPNASTNPNVQLLRNEGVTPTMGQALGGRWNTFEEKAQSIPILGDMIANSRDQARREFNQAAINRATQPVGAQVDGIGQGGVHAAGDAVGAAYDAARNTLGHFQLDQQSLQEMNRINAMVQSLPAQQQRTFRNTLDAIATDVSPNGTITANVFKRIDSRLGADASRFSGSPDPYHQQLGEAFAAMQNAILGAGRRANPQADAMFSAADRAYANLVRVEGAAKSAVNTEGVFTPAQLNAAARAADDSVRNRAVARGTALMQDLGNAGQQVIGNRVPNSFTTDRMLLAGGVAGGLGALSPAALMGLLGGATAYAPGVRGLLSRAITDRPQAAEAAAEALRQASPALIPFGAQVGLGLLNY